MTENLEEQLEQAGGIDPAQETPGADLAKAITETDGKQAPQEPAKPKSLRDELKDSLKASQDRARDEQGRFSRQEQQDKAAAAKAAPDNSQGQQQTPPATQQAKPQPPTSWTAQAKADFDKLPQHVQEAIAKRESEVHRGFTALDEQRNLGKQISEAAQPYMAMIQAEGGTPVSAFKVLLNSAYLLRAGSQEQKIGLVKQLCAEYKIPLDGLTALQQSNPSAQPPQQQQQGLSAEQVSEIVRKEQQQARLVSEVEAFERDPANKYYGQVKQHMAALLLQGLAGSLKEAYEQACWASPQVRSSLEAERIKATEDKRQAELRQKSTAAKHAAGSVSGGPGASTPTGNRTQERSLRDEIAANFRAAQSGAI